MIKGKLSIFFFESDIINSNNSSLFLKFINLREKKRKQKTFLIWSLFDLNAH